MVLALKLCRSPRVWPTSCMVTSLIAWPNQLVGHFLAGLGSRRLHGQRHRGHAQLIAHMSAALAQPVPGRPTDAPRPILLRFRRLGSSRPGRCSRRSSCPTHPLRQADRIDGPQPRASASIRLAGASAPPKQSAPPLRQKRTMLASKMMSASRISPVSGLARDGPIAKPWSVVIQRKVL